MKRWLPEFLVICAILMVVGYGFAQSWTLTSSNVLLQSVAVSADGKRAIAVPSWHTEYISTNWGKTWQYKSLSVYISLVASSADGKKLLAADTSGLFDDVCVSTNSGNSWTQTSLPQLRWTSCATSADGTMLVVAANSGQIYTSTNSGSTWQATSAPSKIWYGLASSTDGTKLVACASTDQIYTSTN
jgi:photosystem II stability/assembly factor-like uncharacterized protein